MSLLESLQSEVAHKRETEVAQEQERQVQEKFYQLQLKPVMLRARAYFQEIVSSLNELEREIQCSFPLAPKADDRVKFVQSNHEFHFDEAENPKRIHVGCKCRVDGKYRFHVATKKDVLNYVDLLKSYGMDYHQKNELDGMYDVKAANFIIEGSMKAGIDFQANMAEQCVVISLYNFGAEPRRKYRLSPEQVTEELLEKVASVLLRRELDIIKVEVSEEYRRGLQAQLESSQLEAEKQVAEGQAYLDSVRKQEEDSKLLNRAKNTLKEKTKGAVSLASGLSILGPRGEK